LAPVDPYIERTAPFAATAAAQVSVDPVFVAAGTPIYVGDAFRQYTAAYTRAAFSGSEPISIDAELTRVSAANFTIHLDARITVSRGGDQIMGRTYSSSSTSTSKVWEGVRADRPLYWQNETHKSLRQTRGGSTDRSAWQRGDTACA